VNCIVCVKQVPDTETQIKIAPDGTSVVTDNIKWVMNPYDEYAVEEALQIKEKLGGEVTVVGVGPKRVTESLRTALAMGADKGILVDDSSAGGSDSLGTARILAAVIKDLDYDLILCGKQGVDDDYGVVGSNLAELLGIPQVSVVVKLEVSDDGKTIKANRELEGGTLIIESPLYPTPEFSRHSPLLNGLGFPQYLNRNPRILEGIHSQHLRRSQNEWPPLRVLGHLFAYPV
jgi:electron transfer flavoprotein beta subunit